MAQNLGPKIHKGRSHHPHVGTKSLGVTLNPTTNYVSGTTMDIYIDGFLTTIDDEYGDSLSITFPAGITVLSGSAGIGNPTTGQGQEALMNINGQTIEWGDNDNFFGGIEPGIFTFYIRIAIPSNQTGPINCTFHMDGDMFGAAPNFYAGTFAINPTPTAPDFVVSAFDDVLEYPIVTIAHAKPITFYANVGNIGTAQANPLDLTVTSQPGTYVNNVPLQMPFNTMTSQVVNTSTAFTPTTIANYEIVHEVNFSGDFDLTNNSDTVRFTVSDTVMARENGVVMNNIGFNGGNGRMGQVFELQTADQLTSASFFSQFPVVGDSFHLEVYNFGTTPGTLISQTQVATFQTATEGWFTVAFDSLINLNAGKFFLCLVQHSLNNISLGVNDAYYYQNTNFIAFGGGATTIWEHAEVYSVQVQYLLRANFGNTITPTLDEPFLLSPSNAAVNVDSNMVMLDWSDVNGASGYYYEVSTDANFGTIINSGNTVVSETTINGMTGETQYFWRVQATAGAAVSFFSTPFSYTTQGPPNSVVEAKKLNIKLYPNPTLGVVYISGTVDANIEVFSLLGELVKTVRVMKNQSSIDCSDLPEGNYLIKIYSNNTTELKKLVIIR